MKIYPLQRQANINAAIMCWKKKKRKKEKKERTPKKEKKKEKTPTS